MKRWFRVLSFFLFPFLFSGLLFAEPVIRDIQVQGNQRIETKAILGIVESRVGSAYSTDKIHRDLKAIYQMGAFDDIQIEKSAVNDGVRLTYIVQERSNITKIIFEGNKKIKEEKLRELIEVKPYSPLDSIKLANSIKKIQEHYAKEGYHIAEITTDYRTTPGTPSTKGQELVFHIHEGEQVRIQRVNFIGNKVFSDKELRAQIKTRSKSYFSWLTGSGKYQEEMVKRDAAFLVYYYQNHGYLKVKVTAPRVYLSRDRRGITVTYHVTEGEKYTIKKLDFTGDILTTKEELLARMKLKAGDLYSRKTLEEDLTLLSQLYGDQGYAFANINPAIVPHDDDHTADITYTLQKGSKVMIERINIIGNTVTRDKVIRRELLVKENTLYNESRLKQSQQKLQALGYFEEVNFATPRGSSDDKIVVNINVKEKPTGTFSIGAGFSSVEKFILTASIAKDNFLGYGVSGQFSTELSSRRQLFILSFEDPYFLDSNWILGLSGFRTVNVFTDFSRNSFGGSLTFGHRVFDYSTFRFTYQFEDVSVGDFTTVVPAIFNQNLSGKTSSAALSLQRDTRNNRLFPTDGLFHNTTVEFAGLGGSNDFFRATENFRYYQPIWKGFVTKFNFTLSQVNSLNNQPVPLFERFFLGGVNSLRGYFLRSIGPDVRIPATSQGGDNRFVYGGTKMMQFNFELEVPLYEPAGFKAVGFIDSGNAFAEEQNFNPTKLRSDYGFGLRWNSPFGPLRFEWGIPFHRNPGEDPLVFNFTIGSFF